MRISSWYVALGIAGLASAAAVACTTTTDTGTGTDNDSGIVDNDSGTDAATTDTGTGTDTGTVVTADAGDAGTTCGVEPSTGTPACDTCLETMCCSQLETCFGTAADASTGCEALVSCVQDLELGNPDGGIAGMSESDALASCAPDGSATDTTNALAVLACLGFSDAGVDSCGSTCGQ